LAYGGNIYKPADLSWLRTRGYNYFVEKSGSILKPFLYAAAMHDALILPNSIIPDIPIQIGGYTPRNFNDEFDGAVPGIHALSRSLNIPAVKILQQYKQQRFYTLMKNVGITTFRRPADPLRIIDYPWVQK
jgi:penicillin-binding protein 1C